MRSKKYTSRISIARNVYLRSSAVLIFFVVVGVVIGDLRGVLRRLLVDDLERWDDGEGNGRGEEGGGATVVVAAAAAAAAEPLCLRRA
eukprot:scaffold5382_cov116-Skeletonema_marinoi.AAC.7